MNFEEAMRWIEEAHAFPTREHLHARRLSWILERSGLRERAGSLPWALVAGSCGKASTARFLAFIARALLDRAGVSAPVALGTKPPLSETPDGQRERYQLFERGASAPSWIIPEDFASYVSALVPVVEALEREAPELGPVAPYDLRYAVLLSHALDQCAAFAVVEANIGLRDDPTSALPPPRAQLLTPIDTDHAQLLLAPSPLPAALAGLGDRAGPVWHKAGGLRARVATVVGLQDEPVALAVDALAAERGVGTMARRGVDYEVLRRRSALDGSDATLRVGDEMLDVRIRAVGGFQVDNAAQAAAAAWALVRDGAMPGDRAAWREAVRAGLGAATMPGRMEVIAERPLTLLQVGASPVKMRAFVEALDELLPAASSGRVVVCASFLARIHDAREPVAILARSGRVSALVATACETVGDAADLDPDEVIGIARQVRPELEAWAVRGAEAAVAKARSLACAEGDVLVLVGNGLGARTPPT